MLIIDDFRRSDLVSRTGATWRCITDQVMGGVSEAALYPDRIDGFPCLRLRGGVKLENDGGFVQMALDLDSGEGFYDAGGYRGVRLRVLGNAECYGVHLRTSDCVRSWQSYRARFRAGPQWCEITLSFADFQPHRLDQPLDVSRLRRLGIVGIGRAFEADIAVAEISLYP